MYSQRDLREWVTISDVLDAHEALDVKAAQADKVRRTHDKNGHR